MEISALSPLGVIVRDLEIAHLGDDAIENLKDLLGEHGVVILPGQFIDDAEFVGFLRRFGSLMFTTGETPVEGFPDLNIVSNVGRSSPPRSNFHVDTSYVARPPAFTALRAVVVPAAGGQTLFTNQYRAYETLPRELATRLAGRSIRHVVTGLDLGPDDEGEATHPVFLLHPSSGRTSLYLTTPARCAGISGLDPAEAGRTVDTLFNHSTEEQNILRHSWSPGDLVMWDNRCVLHRADHTRCIGRPGHASRHGRRGCLTADAVAWRRPPEPLARWVCSSWRFRSISGSPPRPMSRHGHHEAGLQPIERS